MDTAQRRLLAIMLAGVLAAVVAAGSELKPSDARARLNHLEALVMLHDASEAMALPQDRQPPPQCVHDQEPG